MFAKKAIIQTEDGKFKPVHRTALLNQSDSEIVEQYNAEMRGLLNYYNLAVDYHTLDYFCYLIFQFKTVPFGIKLLKRSK